MKHCHFIVLTLLALVLVNPAYALISSEATLSGGYFKDYSEENRTPVFFYWNLNHIASNGVETFVDLGANNNLVQNEWGFYLYQGYVTVPFASGFDTAPAKRSRLQLGRQLLTEGFEFAILDGIQAPTYWSENGGVNLFAGAHYAMQTDKTDFQPLVFGVTAHQRVLGAVWKAGLLQKKKEEASENLSHGSVHWNFENLPFKPMMIGRAQWNLTTRNYDQGYAELGVYPSDTLNFGALYSDRQISLANVDPLESLFIYQIFSISAVASKGGFVTWLPLEALRIQVSVRQSNYTSPRGSETGDEQELTASWMYKRSSISPSLVRIKSYGGELLQPGLVYRRELGDTSALKLQVAASKIDKINGMNSWAYHGRGGIDFRLSPRFTVMTLAEAESNHFFKLDARALAYVSYLLY